MIPRLLTVVLAALPTVLAAEYDVFVGADDKLIYKPEYVHAKYGDKINFIFQSKNHTVTQSTFEQPCMKQDGGFATGFVPVAPGTHSWELPRKEFIVTDDTKPLWFYCGQKNPVNHCQGGMVFAINPPPEGNPRSFSAFKMLAAKKDGSTPTSASQPSPTRKPVEHIIKVGVPPALIFSPASIKAESGDIVTFEFQPKAHGVTQSSFGSPCSPLAGGFVSGIMPVQATDVNKPKFSIKINNTAPLWGYCPQQGPPVHCGEGMVFAINADENGPHSFQNFQTNANRTRVAPPTSSSKPSQPPSNAPSHPPSNSGSNGVCSPSFDFEGVRVANSAINWGASSFVEDVELTGEGDFNKRLEIRFEQVGSPNPLYIAKVLNGSHPLAVAHRPNNNLWFIPWSEVDPNNGRHKWIIECKSGCPGGSQVAPGDLVADGCTIRSGLDGNCVQLGNGPWAGRQGDPISVKKCDGSDSQRWNFPSSPFKATGRTDSHWSGNTANGPKNVAAAISDDGDSVNLDMKQLITSSYVIIGMLGAILLAVIAFGIMAGRGSLKARSSSTKTRYAFVPGKETDSEALTGPSGRYSD